MDEVYVGLGTRIQTRQEARRTSFGQNIHRISDATDYLCDVKVLQPEEIDRLQIETGLNVRDRNAFIMRMPLNCPMKVGDWVLYPSTGTASQNRYRVVSLPPPPEVQGVVGKVLAVCFYDPDRS